ncbi:MAG TPA: hypothetical protein VM328_01205, partial [Fimbriimonadaceae bacterium]|nr:hypothetical protein [Fimbriimonadaceae bacterium]
SAGTDNLGAFLTGMNLSRTSIGVTTDKKLYVGAPLSAGGSSKIVGINIAGAPAGLVFAQAPTVVGEITGLAVSSDHIFVISHVNNSFKLSAFRRDTGVLVTETALAPTANPFVPYRIAASAGGTVYVFGAEITGGNTYHFRVFEVTLS